MPSGTAGWRSGSFRFRCRPGLRRRRSRHDDTEKRQHDANTEGAEVDAGRLASLVKHHQCDHEQQHDDQQRAENRMSSAPVDLLAEANHCAAR